MPTEQQSWLNRYDTYHAATEYNQQHYGKRIKQLKRMLKDEKFLEYLSHKEHKDDILHYLAKSNEFDMYIAYTEQGDPYIHDHDFGLINHMKKNVKSITIRKLYQIFIIKTTSQKICGNVCLV